MNNKRKDFALPHVFILLFLIMLVVWGLSCVLPSGTFEVIQTESGQSVINPEVLNPVENAGIGFMDFFSAVPQGIVESATIIVSVLMVGGALHLIENTGAIGAGIHKIIKVSEGRESLVVALLMFIFAVLGTIGFGEGGLPFIPLCMTVVMAVGFDRMAGVATAQFGFTAGFSSGVFNLFTTGIAQQIVGLPLFSGFGYRILCFVVFYVICLIFLLKYCKKIKNDPTKSIYASEYLESKEQAQLDKANVQEEKMTVPKVLTLAILGFAFIFQAFGALKLGWGLVEIGGLYVIVAVLVAIINRVNSTKACNDFARGASILLPACLTIGMARAVMVLMNEAAIVDPVIKGLGDVLQGKSSATIIILVYISVIAFNFFVVSGSGKAMILMPILGPLAKLTGINQQTMVITYQVGDGITNYVFPASGALIAGLTMCNVRYDEWIKWSWKLYVVLVIVGGALAVISQAIGLGPM